MTLIYYYKGNGVNEVVLIEPVANSSTLGVTVDSDSENDV